MLTIWKSRKSNLMACESIYWTNINGDIEKHIKNCSICLNFHDTEKRIIHHKIPAKPWEIVGTDMFTLHNKNYLCIVNYHIKFPGIKKIEILISKPLNTNIKSHVIRLWFTKENSGAIFISNKFKTICRSLNKEQTFLSSYHHQNNRQVEACIKL